MKNIIMWCLGLFTVILAVGAFGQSALLSGLSFLLASAFVIPPILRWVKRENQWVKRENEKRGKSVPRSGIIAGYTFFFVCGLVLVPSSKDVSSPEVVNSPEMVKERAHVVAENVKSNTLELSAKEFIKRYNESLGTLGETFKFYINKNTENESSIISQVSSENKSIELILVSDKKTHKLDSIMVLGAGDGSLKSGVDIMMGLVASVMALENPFMPVSQRGEIARQLGLSNGELLKEGDIKFTRGNVQYDIAHSKRIGIMLSAKGVTF